MGDVIKEALKLISDRFKNSKGFKVALLILAVVFLFVSVFTVYPSARAGVVTLWEDVFIRTDPELYDITYDSASKTVKGSMKGIKKPEDYRIILFILTDQWYVKPDFDATVQRGMSKLQGKDRFLINAFTQEQYENDIKATQFAVFLVSSSYGGLEHMNDFDGAMRACIDSYIDTIP